RAMMRSFRTWFSVAGANSVSTLPIVACQLRTDDDPRRGNLLAIPQRLYRMQISDTTREEVFRLFGKLVARSDPGRLEAFAHLGLTMTQLRLLFLLRPADGLSAGAVADQLGVTP